MSTTAAPSPTTSPQSMPTYTNASSLLFGFLVSALSIFAIFMTCAIVWNRLIIRRRAIEAMLATSSPPVGSPRLRRPTMWDVWIMPSKQAPLWLDMKVSHTLSTTMTLQLINRLSHQPVAVAQRCDCPPRSSPTPQTERTTPFWRRQINRLPPEITYLFYRPIPQVPSPMNDTNESRVELSHGSDVQVSLLITMPHAPRLARDGEHESHEMVFATTDIFYHDPASS